MSAQLHQGAIARPVDPASTDATHQVTNQPPPLSGYNAWTQDHILVAAANRAQAGDRTSVV